MIKKKKRRSGPQTVEENFLFRRSPKELMEHRQYDVYFMVYDNTGRRLHKKSSFYRIGLEAPDLQYGSGRYGGA